MVAKYRNTVPSPVWPAAQIKFITLQLEALFDHCQLISQFRTKLNSSLVIPTLSLALISLRIMLLYLLHAAKMKLGYGLHRHVKSCLELSWCKAAKWISLRATALNSRRMERASFPGGQMEKYGRSYPRAGDCCGSSIARIGQEIKIMEAFSALLWLRIAIPCYLEAQMANWNNGIWGNKQEN